MKTAFNYCIENDYEAVFLTLYPEGKDYLIELLEEFGFIKYGQNKSGELIFLKYFQINNIEAAVRLGKVDFHIRYSPYFKTNLEDKYLIPIKPNFHYRLFPENQPHQHLFYSSESCSNALRKAYICNSRVRRLKRGDLIFFYRSRDIKAITNLGIIERILISKDPTEIATFVGKRTVYNYREIVEICRKEALAILFRQIKNLEPFSLNKLLATGIINGVIQTIRKIDNDSFRIIFENSQGKIDDNFFTDKTQLCL